MVLSRQEAEALGIQLDSVEQSTEDPQEQQTTSETHIEGITEPDTSVQESEMQQQAELADMNSAESQDLHSEFHSELQAELQPVLQQELQPQLQQELQQTLEPELPIETQDTQSNQAVEQEQQTEASVPPISVPEVIQIGGTQESEVKIKESTKEPVKNVERTIQTATVSLDAVSQQFGEEGGDGDSSANDVLSNIIQSLFNPNEPTQSNVSIVPRMVGGKRKLCLRLPASTASALLAQTGSPLATSFTEGGIPKKIKIVIPPSSMSSNASGIVSSLTNSTAVQEPKVVKMTPVVQPSHTAKTTGPARLDPDTLPSSTLPLLSSPAKSSSKPFLASLFTSTSNSPATPTVTVTPVQQSQPKKPLGSTENPIQLVQEGNSFRSLQPLTPDQLKHIASVLKQNRQAILSGSGDGKGGTSSGTDGEGGKRRVVYDAASNTRIVYRVVTPGELKKSPSVAGVTATPNTVSTVKPTTPTSTGVTRGRGRGRGRPPRTIAFTQTRKPSQEESDSEDVVEEETNVGTTIDMSKV